VKNPSKVPSGIRDYRIEEQENDEQEEVTGCDMIGI
jgi:hypothetical protein